MERKLFPLPTAEEGMGLEPEFSRGKVKGIDRPLPIPGMVVTYSIEVKPGRKIAASGGPGPWPPAGTEVSTSLSTLPFPHKHTHQSQHGHYLWSCDYEVSREPCLPSFQATSL